MDSSLKFGAVVGVFVVGVSAVAIAKQDKAEAPYSECMAAYSSKRLEEARAACNRAVIADPQSASGKKAQEQLNKITARMADEERQAKEDLEAKLAAKHAQDAREASCSRWSTICTLGRHPDGSERTTGAQFFKSKGACEGAGAQFGVPCDPCRCVQ